MVPLILIGTFLIVAVFIRIFVQYRRTGDSGVRTASIGSPIIEVLPGTVFILTFCFALILVILGHTGYVRPMIDLSPLTIYFGFLLGLVGIATIVVSQFQMGDSWRIGVDQQETTTLVTNGLYAKSRNPIYFGLLLFWVGLSMTFPHQLLWLSAAICWVCIELIVRKIEEPYLYKKHGDMFQRYITRTNRYLPF